MPKSKSKRGKKYQPKPIAIPLAVHPSVIKHQEDTLSNIETAFLIKLRNGLCDEIDCGNALNLFNFVMYIIAHQRKEYKEGRYPRDEYVAQLISSARSVKKILNRIKEGKSAVATMAEYDLILDSIQSATTFAKERLHQAPSLFINEWNASLLLVAGAGSNDVEGVRKQIDWCYEQSVKISHMTLTQQDRVFDALQMSGQNALK
jgi:hypothetical protein